MENLKTFKMISEAQNPCMFIIIVCHVIIYDRLVSIFNLKQMTLTQMNL